MADKFSAKITGLMATKRKMSALRANVMIENRDEMEIQVKEIEREAKRTAPRKTADLLRTINSEVEVTFKKGIVGLVGANKSYALPLEDPENKNRPKHRSRKGFIGRPTPFLMPAFKRRFRALASGVARATKKAVRRTA